MLKSFNPKFDCWFGDWQLQEPIWYLERKPEKLEILLDFLEHCPEEYFDSASFKDGKTRCVIGWACEIFEGWSWIHDLPLFEHNMLAIESFADFFGLTIRETLRIAASNNTLQDAKDRIREQIAKISRSS